MKKFEGNFMSSIGSQLWKVAEAISKGKAYLIGNGMDKVLIEALKLFEKLPEKERTVDHLREILELGIEKKHENGKIILKLEAK
jgi:hypothetical protein